MRSFGKVLMLGVVALLLSGLVACNSSETETETETVLVTETETETETVVETETETETETESETVNYADYEVQRDYAYLYNDSVEDSSTFVVTATDWYGATISVSKDCFLTGFSAFTYSWNDNIGEMKLVFWRWDTDYATTTAAEPVFSFEVKDTMDNSWVTVDFPAFTVGEGEWYYEFRDGSENLIGLSIVSGNVRGNENDDVKVLCGYKSGKATRNVFPKAYVTYDKYDTTKILEAPDAAQYTQLSADKAHVIILAGQANATGAALGSLLETHVSEEQMARYREGYSNVLIDYTADNNFSGGFVPVKLGQGQDISRFGPELGLADYLSRTYPNETFYIVKSSASESSLYQSWADNGGSYYFFTNHVRLAMDRLEAKGLEPEIFAMCWMQGEADSRDFDHTNLYADREFDLIDRISEDFDDYMAEGGMAFLDASIYEGGKNAWALLLNQCKRDLASRSQNFYYIDTNAHGIDPRDENDDLANYDSDDMIELGELFGEAISTVLVNAGYVAN